MQSTLTTNFTAHTYFESIFTKSVLNKILLMDEEGIILDVNETFTRSFSYQATEMIGRHISILFAQNNKRMYASGQELFNVLKNGQAADENYCSPPVGTFFYRAYKWDSNFATLQN